MSKKKLNKTEVVPDFSQIPYHVDQIKCPKCSQIQTAKVLHEWPQYAYLHDCVHCGHRITKKDWKSLKLNKNA
jgi:Zn ribbon nucleic-acid-binding protein